jgi:putative ABC transport system permease protein
MEKRLKPICHPLRWCPPLRHSYAIPLRALALAFVGGLPGIVLAYAVSFSVGDLTFYSALAQHGEMGDFRLIISPASVVATPILAVVGSYRGLTLRVSISQQEIPGLAG